MRAIALLALASCASHGSGDGESSDFDPVDWGDGKADASGPAIFDRDNIMTDDVMLTVAVDADGVQQFLEHTPYGSRSWLADFTIEGTQFSAYIVAVGAEYHIDPVVLLSRMQVETSLVSPTTTPPQWKINEALGCGCPDGSSTCSHVGLASQLDCAGQTLASRLADSRDGVPGDWQIGVARTTSDHYRVTPQNDATAALYAYTPWVLPNAGGNWLVWNVTRRYLKQFDAAGTLQLP
jgi:hypothetical protein